jgi:uncharacterized protein (DUF433 family)
MTRTKGIQQTKDTCGGKARIAQRRITVERILEMLMCGNSIETLCDMYRLEQGQVKDALSHALKCVKKEDKISKK